MTTIRLGNAEVYTFAGVTDELKEKHACIH